MDGSMLFLSGFILFFVILLLWILPIPLWLSAKFANVHVSLIQLVFMRFRRVPPSTIVNALVTATKAGIDVQRDMLEAHYLAGGNVPKVIRALISADKANIDLISKRLLPLIWQDEMYLKRFNFL
jgi:uncharacterized protein YqfA (UPF0365 family)